MYNSIGKYKCTVWKCEKKRKKNVNHIFIWRTPDGIVRTPGGYCCTVHTHALSKSTILRLIRLPDSLPPGPSFQFAVCESTNAKTSPLVLFLVGPIGSLQSDNYPSLSLSIVEIWRVCLEDPFEALLQVSLQRGPNLVALVSKPMD